MAEPKNPDPSGHGTAATVGNKSQHQVGGISGGAPNSPPEAQHDPHNPGTDPRTPPNQQTHTTGPSTTDGNTSTSYPGDQRKSESSTNPDRPDGRPLDHDVVGVDKIKALVDILPKDTPEDHVYWGYGGYRVKHEDLLHIAGKKRK